MIIDNTNPRRGAMAFLLSLIIFLCAGCNALPHKAKSPTFKLTTPQSGTIEANGDAQTPAKVETTQTETTVPIPANSQVSFVAATPTEPAKTVITLAQPSIARTVTKSEHITAPIAFTPPAGPTLGEQTDANAVTRSYYFAGALGILAALLAYRAHVKAAVIAGLCALAVVPVTKFIGSTWGQFIVIAGVCIAGALFAAWHFMNDKQRAALEAKLPVLP